MESFIYNGVEFTPKRKFTKAERKKGLLCQFSSVGMSNYDFRPNDIGWNFDEFYDKATEVGAGKIDVFEVKGYEVVPADNELFQLDYKKHGKLSLIEEPEKVLYNHALDVAFEVVSESETEPTVDEILLGLEKRLKYLKKHRDEVHEACDVFDTHEEEK
jgi:hypothetical protein